MGKKRKSWVHIDSAIGEGGSSEFDSLGAVEELTEYNEEDLAEIIADVTASGPSKKKRKRKLSNTDEENSTNNKQLSLIHI